MANVRLTDAVNNAVCDALVDLIDTGGAGTIKLYDGTQPATGDTAITSQTLLGTLPFSATAFGASSSGVATAASITGDSSADASGTATWARIADGNGLDQFDCDVNDDASATIDLNTNVIVAGQSIDITSFTMTHPDGT